MLVLPIDANVFMQGGHSCAHSANGRKMCSIANTLVTAVVKETCSEWIYNVCQGNGQMRIQKG